MFTFTCALAQVQEVNIFDNSMDSLGGGAVFADRDSSSASFDELLYNIGLEDDKIQECPVTFGKLNITQEEVSYGNQVCSSFTSFIYCRSKNFWSQIRSVKLQKGPIDCNLFSVGKHETIL